jgi:hypothetical protein
MEEDEETKEWYYLGNGNDALGRVKNGHRVYP